MKHDELTSRRFLVILMAIASALVLLLIAPFAGAFFTAAMLAGALHPAQDWLKAHCGGRRHLAAGLVTAGTLVVVVAPILLLGGLVLDEASELEHWIVMTAHEEGIEGLVDPLPEPLRQPARRILIRVPETILPLAETPEKVLLEQAEAHLRAREDAAEAQEQPRESVIAMTPALGKVADVTTDALAGFAKLLLSLGVLIVSLFFLLSEGERLAHYIIVLTPLPESSTRQLLDLFREITVAVFLSTLVTGISQTLVALVGYLIAGVPAPSLVVALTLLFSFVPAVGAATITVIAGLLMWMSGDTGFGIFLVLWGLVPVALTDNVLRPLLVAGRATLPASIVFFAMICGLAVFGPLGLVAGPLVVAFFMAVAHLINGSRPQVPAKPQARPKSQPSRPG